MQNGNLPNEPEPADVAEQPDRFYEQPILNSPYDYPGRHWELDESNRPTNQVIDRRRPSAYVSPIPRPRKHEDRQLALVEDAAARTWDPADEQYDLTAFINGVRRAVDEWRALPESAWQVTPETARLLRHWRGHAFGDVRPFFCQVEAAETAIWLTEVAPRLGKRASALLRHLARANAGATAEGATALNRVALKLATGAGKTTVMALLIAWQTVNAVRRPGSPRFTKGFLVVTPGVTIRRRLRVLQPNDPDSYYASRELAPADMLRDLEKARIVITNYHAFQPRETLALSAGGRALLQGRGAPLRTRESDGQMLHRVLPELMGLKRIWVLNDEAHHCYREKPAASDEGALKGDDRREAKKNRETARVWMSGLEAVDRKLGVGRVVDLSATPFFLRGSGYAEGTLFPWTASDFSLMDAIECGIVKLPRVPVADNVPGAEMPQFRELWKHVGRKMPKKGRGQAAADPLQLPAKLLAALEALYGHYERTFDEWRAAGIRVPPCFIVVCNNTSTSKLVYDWISGFRREHADGTATLEQGRLALFRNFDEHGQPLARPRTLLIDSEQLDSGDALDRQFRTAAADEIERFRREIVERTGDRRQAERISDEDLLREVVNTVGVEGRLGEQTRCVVSVSMLSEGWDARTVTHVLGVRAFGTQLLCEQIVGRALRRQSYQINPDTGLFDVEYADVFGIPFDFTAKPVVAPPQPPRETVLVRAVSPDRDACEIRFPRVQGYVVQTPAKIIQRCILMATEPCDVVLDPTCGSGTAAYVAEQWGRRWITIDTSRVALALARARVMGARYPWYVLVDSPEGQRKAAELTRTTPSEAPTHGDVRQGFVYERVPHVTLKSIANNAEIDTIWRGWQETLQSLREDLNALLDRDWEEWRIPREAGDPWSEVATEAWNALVNAAQDRSAAPAGHPGGAKRRAPSVPATADGRDAPPVAPAGGAKPGGEPLRGAVGGPAKRSDPVPGPVAVGAKHGGDPAQAVVDLGPKHGRQPDTAIALATLNEALDRHYTLEDLPDRPYDPWRPEAMESHRLWWEARIARQQEIDASIAARADVEYLYDRPYDDPKRIRVAGPFTVESLSPHRLLAFDESGELIDRVAERPPAYSTAEDFAAMALGHLATSGVQQAHQADRLTFSSVDPWPGQLICAQGRYTEGDDGPERRAGIVVGPEFGTVARQHLVRAAREAGDAGFDVLVACAFNFEPHATEFNKLGALPMLKARMNADLHMADDLANTGNGNLFVIFGEPDIEIRPAACDHPETGRIQVQIRGVDVFHPGSGEVRSDGPDGIACWFIDTDYDDESFFVRQAYFLGANDPYKALRTTLKAEIDADAWATLHSDASRPFARPGSGRIAVKVINHLGDEVMKVFDV